MTDAAASHRRAAAILFLAGLGLTLVEYAALKEFASLLGSNELVAIVVLAAYFLGMSCGYLVSDRLSEESVVRLGAATLLLHATLPFSGRYAAGWLCRLGLGRALMLFVFLAVLVGISPFFALALPRLVGAAGPDRKRELVRAYAAELSGALAGLLLITALGPARLHWVLAAHLAGLAALVILFSKGSPGPRLGLAALPALYLLAFGPLNRSSLEYYYKHVRGFRAPVLVASEFSPYQRVDLIQEGDAPEARKYLYLNGNLLYGTRSLNDHNLFVSILPNLIAAGRGAPNSLILGGGSLDSARALAPRVGRLRVVELDETVTRLTRRFVQEPRGGMPGNWDLVIDDGKHFLGNYSGPAFDVVSVDIPVPTSLQTAMLHSRRFFALAHSRMAPGGIFSISLARRYQDEEPGKGLVPKSFIANRITAGLLAVFKHVTVVNSGGTSFAWASDQPLPADPAQIDARLSAFLDEPGNRGAFGSPGFTLVPDGDVRDWARGHAPIGEADMQIVLRMSVRKLVFRFL